ncbi:MAG TPA: hypothetical protein VLS93_01070, partial [Anaeromyxobacteraceae bacterium]|nr:hypothetical protein [Anaeromyxobacteraceae bacterium]
WILGARRARRRSLGARSVEIVGSVPFSLRVGRWAVLLAIVAAVMAVVAWAAAPSSSGVSLLAGAAAVLCAGLVPLVLFAPPSRRAVVFEPDGLRFVEASYDVRVPWDQIVHARILDIEDTLVVALSLRDAAGLVPIPRGRSRDPPAALRRLSRAVSLNRAFYGCDLSIGPAAHGLDPVLFCRAIQTYVSDPAARPRLAPRAALDTAREAEERRGR